MIPKIFTGPLAYLAALFPAGATMTEDQKMNDVPETGGVVTDAQRLASDVVGDLKAGADRVAGQVRAAFSAVETDAQAVLGKLGHAHNVLSGLSVEAAIAGEVAVVKSAIENAIIAVAKHIGG